MDDLAGKLNEILSNPAEMAKFQQMANNLLGQMNTGQQTNQQTNTGQNLVQQQPTQQPVENQQQNNNGGGLDLSQLSALLGQQSTPAGAPQDNSNPSGNSGGLGNLLGALGGSGGLGNALGALGGGGGGLGNALGALGGGASPEMLNTIMKIAFLLGNLNQEDDNTRLLGALRPLLKSERQKKLDEAIKIMRMLKFLPILKEQGILQGIL